MFVESVERIIPRQFEIFIGLDVKMQWCQALSQAINITTLSVSQPTRLQLNSYQQVPVVAFYRYDAAAL